MKTEILNPISNVQIVDRTLLKANDYNPNKVLEENLRLLLQSILTNGWTMPIVVRKDYTIIDGFHRWMISGREPLLTMLGGKVPVVIVDHKEKKEDMYGTVTHNKARGTHLLEPMQKIVRSLIAEGVTIPEIAKQLGMKEEEVYRLSDMKREDFLKMLVKKTEYSKAFVIRKVDARAKK